MEDPLDSEEVLKGRHLVVLRTVDLPDLGAHLASVTEDLTIPLEEVEEEVVDHLEVPEVDGEVEGDPLIVPLEGVEVVLQRGALEVVEVQEVVGEVSQVGINKKVLWVVLQVWCCPIVNSVLKLYGLRLMNS